jgi:hypothetical protein
MIIILIIDKEGQIMQMTTGTIPAVVSDMEKLAAYAGLALQKGNQGLKVTEAPNYQDFAAQASVFPAEDGTNRLVIRLCLKLDPDYMTNGKKLYENVMVLSDQIKPTGF